MSLVKMGMFITGSISPMISPSAISSRGLLPMDKTKMRGANKNRRRDTVRGLSFFRGPKFASGAPSAIPTGTERLNIV